MDDKLPLEHWTTHDLRRSFSTHCNELSLAEPHIIEAAINHVGGAKAGVAGTYNRAQWLPQRRQLLEAWGRPRWPSSWRPSASWESLAPIGEGAPRGETRPGFLVFSHAPGARPPPPWGNVEQAAGRASQMAKRPTPEAGHRPSDKSPVPDSGGPTAQLQGACGALRERNGPC